MGRNDNFDKGSGRRRRVVGSQINQAKRDEQSRRLREGDRPRQGQDPEQGFPITVYPENKCEHCDAAYFMPNDLQNHTDIKHPPRFL
jgi:hypothetical protein